MLLGSGLTPQTSGRAEVTTSHATLKYKKSTSSNRKEPQSHNTNAAAALSHRGLPFGRGFSLMVTLSRSLYRSFRCGCVKRHGTANFVRNFTVPVRFSRLILSSSVIRTRACQISFFICSSLRSASPPDMASASICLVSDTAAPASKPAIK